MEYAKFPQFGKIANNRGSITIGNMDTAWSQNVQEIARIEREALERRSPAERFGDLIASQAGRMWYIALHALWFLFWMGYNAGWASKKGAFDPFPFPMLTLMVALEAIFLALFILMSQNRATRQADHRAHLDLQINLLSEHENTMMLRMLQALCAHHGLEVGAHPEISELAARTNPREILEELTKHVPTPEETDASRKGGQGGQ